MKVLMLNGSPHAKGNTYTALHEMEKVFGQEGMETEILHIGNQDIRGCIGCRSCKEKGMRLRRSLSHATVLWSEVRFITLLPMRRWWLF